MNVDPTGNVIKFIPQDGASLTEIVQSILNWIFGIIGIVAVVMIIIGGFNFMTSAGDPGKVKKGKEKKCGFFCQSCQLKIRYQRTDPFSSDEGRKKDGYFLLQVRCA